MRKLKVFQAQIGFYDTVVAAPSRAAALRAWGTHQNLFATGDAADATDAGAIAAAIEHPEQPLRRAVGSQVAFSLEPTSLPNLPDPPPRQKRTLRKPSPRPRPAADRSELDAAEAELRKLEAWRLQEEVDFRKEADALEARCRAAQDRYTRKHQHARDLVAAARKKYQVASQNS